MAARRETRRERDAFMARLEGRSLGERQRLSMEHRAYLNGERDADADFGPEESHLETATSAAGTTSLSSTTEPRPLAHPPSPRPPLGKDACYLARKAAEAKKKRAAGKKKMTKRQEVALRREKKKTKDELVRARAEHAAAARSGQKKNERERATLEEQRGRQARDQAILQLSSKAPAKRKGTSKSGSRIVMGQLCAHYFGLHVSARIY
ncbi:hypothetical protein PI124_g23366 [Phytophthora idaei]|nr:hypothetical protein PI124_g23366 [Phytophthora idaei]